MKVRIRRRHSSDGRDLRLVVEPAKAVPGDNVALRCNGYQSGPWGATLLAAAEDGTWTPVYALNASGFQKYPLPERAGPVIMPAIAVVGPIQVKVPPVEPGKYRIERGVFPSKGPIEQRVAVGYLTVIRGSTR